MLDSGHELYTRPVTAVGLAITAAETLPTVPVFDPVRVAP